ncbi:MAG: AMP-binding protein [Candidatus Marinamargulisbacteria bacterium]
MNGLLFFNHQTINSSFDPSSLVLMNGVAIIRWDNSAKALQAIGYCLVERQSFFIVSSAWSKPFYTPFLSLINDHSCPAASCLIATSGTAGVPKLCVHPIANLFLAAERATSTLPSMNLAEFVLALPPVAMGGLLTIVKALSLQRPIYLSADHWLTNLAQLSQPALAIVPQQVPKLVQHLTRYPQGVHSILIGGDALPPQHRQQLKNINCPISISYGATETAGQIMASMYSDDLSAPLSPLAGITVMTSDAGQLLIKAPTLATGYLTINGIIPLPVNSDGFFVSNDVVELTPQFKVLGRVDFQFKNGGQMVNPEMIEAAFKSAGLVEHMLVVPHPDQTLGNVPVAFINDKTKQDRLTAFALEHLPIHLRPTTYRKLPNGFEFSDPLLRRKLLAHIGA